MHIKFKNGKNEKKKKKKNVHHQLFFNQQKYRTSKGLFNLNVVSVHHEFTEVMCVHQISKRLYFKGVIQLSPSTCTCCCDTNQ
jgi:hypothetical protein